MPFTYLICGLLLCSGIISIYYKPYYQALIFHPYEVFRGKRIHTIFSSAFIHKSWFHLLINIYIFFGPIRDIEYIILENDFTPISIKTLIGVLLLCTIILSNLLVGWKERSNISFSSVGFSAAAFGFLSFSLIYLPLDVPSEPSNFLPVMEAYKYELILFVVLTLMFILFKKGKTNHKAHFIGFIIGFLIAIVCRPVLVVELYSHLFKG